MEEHSSFRALMLEQAGEGVRAEFREVPASALPEGDVLVRVAYSSLNYKDGLAVTGKGRIVQQYPMVPGIDLTGTVMESRAAGWKPGDEVVLTGWGIGERHWGGYAGLARVKGEWLVPLPSGLILRDAMVLGTAGFTAMLCVLALEGHGLSPEWAGDREVVVTGASGGVGSVAVAVLGRLGYNVTAVSGRAEAGEYLRALGARQVVGRDALPTGSSRPLESQRWAGAVDVVGGEVLAALLRQMAYNSGIAICGLAGGSNLTTSVFPFILRGVGLLGVESVLCPPERRRLAWERLARDLPKDALARIGHVHPLADVPALAEQILRGQVRGRAVIDVNA
jgi:acrylyl-CoA reductase (NADPH)